jgi:hypothetical protein
MGGDVQVKRAQLWQERIARQERGKWSVAEFCRGEGVWQPSFYKWRTRLRSNGPEQGVGKPRGRASNRPEFVSVDVSSSLGAAGIQIELPGGSVVRLPHD